MGGAGARALRGARGTGVYLGEKEVHVFRCIYHGQKATLDRPYSGKAGKKYMYIRSPWLFSIRSTLHLNQSGCVRDSPNISKYV